MILRDAALRLSCIALLFAWSCDDGGDSRFSTPASTFFTYREALSQGDADLAWACLSEGYRDVAYGGDLQRWRTSVSGEPGRRLAREVSRREISEEHQINERVGFLQFDPSTVPLDEGPFFYFLQDPEGWKITVHTDSLFRAELEAAIERGEFILPR